MEFIYFESVSAEVDIVPCLVYNPGFAEIEQFFRFFYWNFFLPLVSADAGMVASSFDCQESLISSGPDTYGAYRIGTQIPLSDAKCRLRFGLIFS